LEVFQRIVCNIHECAIVTELAFEKLEGSHVWFAKVYTPNTGTDNKPEPLLKPQASAFSGLARRRAISYETCQNG
jgi:hypothetical protein